MCACHVCTCCPPSSPSTYHSSSFPIPLYIYGATIFLKKIMSLLITVWTPSTIPVAVADTPYLFLEAVLEAACVVPLGGYYRQCFFFVMEPFLIYSTYSTFGIKECDRRGCNASAPFRCILWERTCPSSSKVGTSVLWELYFSSFIYWPLKTRIFKITVFFLSLNPLYYHGLW